MSTSKKIHVEQFEGTVKAILDDYSNAVLEDAREVIRKIAVDARKEVKAKAPVDTGEYKKGWSMQTLDGRRAVSFRVYQKKRYNLTHLLEKGHAKRGGGRVAGIPHIAPAEQNAATRLRQELKKTIQENAK